MPADAWLFDVDLPAEEIRTLYQLLDCEERARAMHFRFAVDRDRFIGRRGRMRRLLGSYLGERAEDIGFTHNAFGKPMVAGEDGLHFSLSHSHGVALCAVAWDRAVGCDLEWQNEALAERETAGRLFSQEERQRLHALPAAQWIEGFYNCWTRKEAFVKALGVGLSHPLDSFDVSVAPGEPAVLLSPAGAWSMHGFAPRHGFRAAVVVEGIDQPVRFRGVIPTPVKSAA
jgi:4'-phosphopantetheinyl transferase